MQRVVDMIDAEDRAARQRSFFLHMSPQLGHEVAALLTGLPNPGNDSRESELRDSLMLWFKMQSSGASAILEESSWWMTRFMDRNFQMNREEANLRSAELVSFAVASLGLLLDNGTIMFTKEPEIPTIVTSGFNPETVDIERAILDRLESSLRKEEE